MTELRSFLAPAGTLPQSEDLVDSALETVRRHLGMDVAYLSEFVGDTIVFRAIRAPGLGDMVKVGDSMPQEEVYCTRIRDGLLPRLIQDTRDYPLARQIGLTETLPIRSHVSVPITGHDGAVFGMFCCLGHEPAPGLNQRDLAVMELFADLSAGQVNAALRARSSREAAQMRIDNAINGGFHMVFQPIKNLRDGQTLGYEALCRFDSVPYRSPDQWFAEAASIDRATELEIHVIEAALSSLPEIAPDRYLSINASPQAVASGGLAPVLQSVDVRRVVLEMTEHARVDDYDEIIAILAPLRAEGLRVAVDDAGAGYAGLQHILRLRPDLIKLDMSLTRDIDTDDARRSLASALITFVSRTNATLIAEGIETEQERDALIQIGVLSGQGYLLGRPLPCATAFCDPGPRPAAAQRA
jgi:EAL domain-containing protein (putative c-di-GMP-specific phosphodiesterase class I)